MGTEKAFSACQQLAGLPPADPKAGLEAWLSVTGFPQYEVSSHGGVRNRTTGRRLKASPDAWGYPRVTLRRAGEGCYRKVHILVLEAFIGPRPNPKFDGRHLDGTRNNNNLDNLAWGTHAENAEDSRRHGTMIVGSRHCAAKLTEDDVAAIRRSALPSPELARIHRVAPRTIRDARNQITWRHVS